MVPLDKARYETWVAESGAADRRGLVRTLIIGAPVLLWCWFGLRWIQAQHPASFDHGSLDFATRTFSGWTDQGLRAWMFQPWVWTGIWFGLAAGAGVLTWLAGKLADRLVGPMSLANGDLDALARVGGYSRDGEPWRWPGALEQGERAMAAVGADPGRGTPAAMRHMMVIAYLQFVLLTMVAGSIYFMLEGAPGLTGYLVSATAVTLLGLVLAISDAPFRESAAIALAGWLSIPFVKWGLYGLEPAPMSLLVLTIVTGAMAIAAVAVAIRRGPRALLITDRRVMGYRRTGRRLEPPVAQWTWSRPVRGRLVRRLWHDVVVLEGDQPVTMPVSRGDADAVLEALPELADDRHPAKGRAAVVTLAGAVALVIALPIGRRTAEATALDRVMVPAFLGAIGGQDEILSAWWPAVEAGVPRCPEVWAYRGMALGFLGRDDDARAAVNHACELAGHRGKVGRVGLWKPPDSD